jgi:hypothetical protein
VADQIFPEGEILVLEKCTKQLVQIVAQNAKFHLNPQKADQYIAEIALQSINPPEDRTELCKF